ncbi:MAG: hypothetical protein IPO21_18755 [Bacteroidales bacterium]|nr:hypothetical protein [Bacteroidales bacterium]
MKNSFYKIVAVILVCLFTLPVQQLSAQDKQSKEYYESQIYKYTKKKKKGAVKLAIGIPCLVGGVACIAASDWYTQSGYGGVSVTTNDPQGGVGILLMFTGIPLTIIGAVQRSKGTRKVNEFTQKLNNMSIYPVKTKRLHRNLPKL